MIDMEQKERKQKHSLREWLLATRPWSFPASAMPVLVTLAYLYWRGEDVNGWHGLWALLNIIVFHAAGNTWSDYADYMRGVDTPASYGATTLVTKRFAPAEIRRLSLGLLLLGVLGGLLLVWRTGIPLLWIGAGGLVCTLLYPPLKYRALGDAVIAVTYGWLPVWGTSFVATGRMDMSTLLLAVPVGMITVAILHANNTRDIRTDARAAITTLAMKIGVRSSARLYAFWIGFPFVFVVACVCLRLFPAWALLVFAALPPALSHIRTMDAVDAADTASISRLDERTAQLQLQFSLLFVLSFLLAHWVR